MNTRKPSRSILRTQTLLKQGLTDLMKETPVHKISVKQLTDHVNLNRGTFYLHYKDIQDLLEHIEKDLLNEFLQINDSHQAREMEGHPFPLILDLYKYLEKNADFVRILLVENQEKSFIGQIKEILRSRCLRDWNTVFEKADPTVCEIYSAYVLNGCIGIIEHWIKTGTGQTPEELARYTEDIMMKGLGILM